MKQYSILLLLLSFPILLPAQPAPFSKVFGDSLTTEQGVSVIQLSSGSIIMAGTARVDSIGGSDVSLSKFSPDGTLLWQKYFGTPLDDFTNGMIQVDNMTLAISGSSTPPNLIGQALIIMLDTNGQEIWTKNYIDTSRSSYFKTINHTDDGKLIASGGIAALNNNGNDSYIAKIDLNGDLLWTSTLRDSAIDIAHATVNSGDGGYIVAGDIQRDGGHYNLYAAKLDGMGQVVWKKTFESINNGGSQNLIKASNGNFLIVGEAWPDTMETYFDVYMIMMRPNGDVIWNSYIGDPFAEAGYKVYEAEPGVFIAGGYGFNFTNNSTDIIVTRVDSLGNEIDRKYFGNQFLEQGFDIAPSIYGGFLATGFATRGPDDQYFLVYDQFPPIDPNGIREFQSQPIYISPNPVQAGNLIHLGQIPKKISWQLTDIHGRVIDSFVTQLNEADYQTPLELSGGIYFLTGRDKNTVYRGKLLILHD